MAAAEKFVTSTGGLGIDTRDDGRLYVNGKGYGNNPEELVRLTDKIQHIHNHRDKVQGGQARTVFRGIVSADLMDSIADDSPIRRDLEAALPLYEFTGDKSVLVTFGRNGAKRKSRTPVDEIKTETSNYRTEIETPLNLIEGLVANKYTFTNTIKDEDVSDVMELWGGTFGWTTEKVEALQHRLKAASELEDPSKKDVWFSALRSPENKIIGISFAERLQRPGKDGKIIDTVESTDWRVHPKYTGNGFMPATLVMLNAQILNDLEGSGNGLPIIYAECNYTSRADKTGVKAGFQIPPRDLAPQILIQNAEVDGAPRDFSFMYVPKSAIDQHYSLEARASMTAHLNPVKV